MNNVKVLTENDYKVLSRMFDVKQNIGLSKIKGITRKTLTEKTGLSYTKVRMAISLLMEYGFVDMGIAKGKEMTFYITEKGLLELKNITLTSVKIEGGNINE